jgi:hypothetical protein
VKFSKLLSCTRIFSIRRKEEKEQRENKQKEKNKNNMQELCRKMKAADTKKRENPNIEVNTDWSLDPKVLVAYVAAKSGVIETES